MRQLQYAPKAAAPAPEKSGAQNSEKPAAAKAPQGQSAQSAPQKQPVVQQPVSRVPQKKIVDTRKGGDVNLAKYDQRLEDLGGERAARMERKSSSGKEKIRSTNQRRGGMTFSNKRRQDEAEKMRRLQLEIAKKAPVKVMIPDEISVGELASRMKKTGAEVVKRLPGFPIVLHGSSSVPQDFVRMINANGGKMPDAVGIPEEQLRQAARSAVCKINIDSDLRLAMTGTIRQFFNEHPDKFDPREYLKPARAAIKELVRHKLIDVLGCNGKA